MSKRMTGPQAMTIEVGSTVTYLGDGANYGKAFEITKIRPVKSWPKVFGQDFEDGPWFDTTGPKLVAYFLFSEVNS